MANNPPPVNCSRCGEPYSSFAHQCWSEKEKAQARRSAAACSPGARQYQCDECRDTGYFGDNGPGIRGNNEYTECDCRRKLKTDDEKWRDHFVYPIALEMKRRGIGELRIKLKGNGKADFELIPENEKSPDADEKGNADE